MQIPVWVTAKYLSQPTFMQSALKSSIPTLTCCMNSLTPWMKAGTPDVVTVIVGAPPGPAPAPPATPKREPRSWPRSGGISWGWGSLALVSGWLVAFTVGGGVGPEVEKEKEEEEEDEEVWEEEESEEEVEVDVDVEVDVTVGPAVKKKTKKEIEISLINSNTWPIFLNFELLNTELEIPPHNCMPP